MTLIEGSNWAKTPDMADEAADDMVGKETEIVFAPVQPTSEDARIRVIGIGGGGGNAVQRMEADMAGHVEVFCINTDAQALRNVKVGQPVQIGHETTKGLGAGASPEVGRQAAMESRDLLAGLVENVDMLFITAGMGGGTGTGAAPVIAEMAKETGALTVAVVTRPFCFEGVPRGRAAEEGIRELGDNVDSIITIPNDRLISELSPDITMEEAFAEADKVLHGAVFGISDLILCPGIINVDFADVRTVMRQRGLAMMGTGIAEGENRAGEAAKQAINCRLLDSVDIANAQAMLVNVTTSGDLSLPEFSQIADDLKPLLDADAQIVMGTTRDLSLENQLKVTIVVAGFGEKGQARAEEKAEPIAGRRQKQQSLREITTARPLTHDAVNGKETESQGNGKAVAVPQVETEGNCARAPKGPDWSKGEYREMIDIPAYLRNQHD